MSRTQLKLYTAPESAPEDCQAREEVDGRVTLTLGDLFPLLLDAVQSQRTWLADFEEDDITISADLYDVIRAYQHFRPSA